jgi:hypothetical protein
MTHIRRFRARLSKSTSVSQPDVSSFDGYAKRAKDEHLAQFFCTLSMTKPHVPKCRILVMAHEDTVN